VTPIGTHVLRTFIDCGEQSEPLALEVLMVGGAAAGLFQQLEAGSRVRVTGKVCAVPPPARRPAAIGVRVMADEIIITD
jgi:hypothetical protein